MIEISSAIVHMAAEDEDKRDYTNLIHDAFFATSRVDEIGVLARSYFNLVCMLHNKTEEKKKTPKYPVNPFHIAATEEGQYTWDWSRYYRTIFPRLTQPSAPISLQSQGNSSKIDGVNDIVAKPLQNKLPTDSQRNVVSSGGVGDGIGMDVLSGLSKVQKQVTVATSGEVADDSANSRIRRPTLKVRMCSSLGSMLLSLMTFYLMAIAVVMILTIVFLSKDGKTWMNDTVAQMETKQMQTLDLVASTKAVFVKVS